MFENPIKVEQLKGIIVNMPTIRVDMTMERYIKVKDLLLIIDELQKGEKNVTKQ